MARLMLLLLLTVPAAAQSIEERLAALEAEVADLRARNAALEARLAALSEETGARSPAAVAPPIVAPAGKEAILRIGGLLQAQGESGGRVDSRYTSENDRVFLRRARVFLQGGFAEHFGFRMELDAAGTLGNTAAMRAQLTDAYIDWTRQPALNIRAGQFKTPFGFEQLYSDPLLFIPERALVSDRLTLGRQLGLQASGELVPARLRYAVGLFNGNGTNVSFNDDDGFLAAGRLTTTLWQRGTARWTGGANAYRSTDTGPGGSVRRAAWGADAQLTAGRAHLWSEFLRTVDPATSDGWYAQGGYEIVPNRLQAVIRFETLDGPASVEETWTGGLNYFIKGHDLKLQIFYMQGREDGRVVARLQTVF